MLDRGPRRGHRRRHLTLLLSVLVVGAAGCGAAGNVSGGRKASAAARTPSGLALPGRLLSSSRVPGFTRLAVPTVVRNAREWNADAGLTDPQLTTETAWLDRHGFVGGVREVLARENRSAAQIDSIVEEFGSGSAAGAELADRYAQAERTGQTLNRRFTPFDVPRIPGAVGYDTAAPDALGHTVAFASGDFYYRVDSSAPPRDRFAPSRARVISAAVALYERMRAGGPV